MYTGKVRTTTLLKIESRLCLRIFNHMRSIDPFPSDRIPDAGPKLVGSHPAHPSGVVSQPSEANGHVGFRPTHISIELSGVSQQARLTRGHLNHGLAEGDNVKHKTL
jgi:hypothetical protein